VTKCFLTSTIFLPSVPEGDRTASVKVTNARHAQLSPLSSALHALLKYRSGP
jgi:hypothetical protein